VENIDWSTHAASTAPSSPDSSAANQTACAIRSLTVCPPLLALGSEYALGWCSPRRGCLATAFQR
jgi:hypothetical protein